MLDRGTLLANLESQLQACRADCRFYRTRLVQGNKVIDLVREMRDYGEALSTGLRNALEEYDDLTE